MGGARRHSGRRPWGLAAVTVGYLVWSLAPLVLAVVYSFNSADSITRWEGFSLRWWIGRPRAQESILYNPDVRTALAHSLLLASIATAVAVPAGVAYALGSRHWRARIARASDATMLLALALPPVMLATALWLTFIGPLRRVPFGDLGWFATKAQVAGLITLELPVVAVLVGVRLLTIGLEQEEMAVDLGAPPRSVLRRVVLPQAWPVVVAAAAVSFALGLGEFVVTGALSSTSHTRTLAMTLFGARANPSPRYSAVGATLALAGLLAGGTVAVAFLGIGKAHRGITGTR